MQQDYRLCPRAQLCLRASFAASGLDWVGQMRQAQLHEGFTSRADSRKLDCYTSWHEKYSVGQMYRWLL